MNNERKRKYSNENTEFLPNIVSDIKKNPGTRRIRGVEGFRTCQPLYKKLEFSTQLKPETKQEFVDDSIQSPITKVQPFNKQQVFTPSTTFSTTVKPEFSSFRETREELDFWQSPTKSMNNQSITQIKQKPIKRENKKQESMYVVHDTNLHFTSPPRKSIQKDRTPETIRVLRTPGAPMTGSMRTVLTKRVMDINFNDCVMNDDSSPKKSNLPERRNLIDMFLTPCARLKKRKQNQ